MIIGTVEKPNQDAQISREGDADFKENLSTTAASEYDNEQMVSDNSLSNSDIIEYGIHETIDDSKPDLSETTHQISQVSSCKYKRSSVKSVYSGRTHTA
ncbi:hypothetical protein AVEN_252285-1 [Araneus ventricosus]|uniref:Uncharacterized protein n=1 Tax=Araneus ventricosus TaxID=182803 RepID=A0A4Y2DNV8_ARAVE|nr:hypothetical protein AVEN_252285-1 [Araneus ventricosus]